MRIFIFLLFFVFFRVAFAQETYQFLENKKQWDESVRYRADIGSGFLFLKANAWHFAFYENSLLAHQHGTSQSHRHENSPKAHGISVQLLGANPQATLFAEMPKDATSNFFLGENPEKWASDVQSFQKITYNNIYEGIDVRFFTQEQSLKYEWVVRPYAKAQQIRWQYEGTDQIEIIQNEVKVSHILGFFKETKLYCYQVINGEKKTVEAEFVREGNVFSIKLGKYNPQHELIIDPTLVFSSYSGSRANNWGFTAAPDLQENVYAGGIVFGADFPTTAGVFNLNFGGLIDVGILKFSADGRRLLYSTFLGGSQTETPHSLIVNSKNELVIMGSTSSQNFPTSQNAIDRTYNGGTNLGEVIGGIPYNNGSDIFVSILSENGNQLLASTYLGGSNNDGINLHLPTQPNLSLVRNYGDEFRGDVFVDKNDFVYVSSVTRSTNFPTINASQSAIGGQQDAVVVKMNASLSQIFWSSYLGGSGIETGNSIKVNEAGEVYVVGATTSANFPITQGSLRPTYSGNIDAYIVKYNANGLLINSTFLGTAAYDQAYFVDLDTEQNPYVLGNTNGNYTIVNAPYSNGNSGQFIHKLNATLSQTLFTTRVGRGSGSPDLALTAFMVSDCGNIYLAGWGGSTNVLTGFSPNSSTTGLPITNDAYQKTTDGSDFYMMILGKNASSLLYGSFFGGAYQGQDNEHVDGGTSRFSKNGKIYQAVCACRDLNFPTSPNVVSNRNGANTPLVLGCNNAVFKLELQSLKADIEIVDEKGESVRTVCAPFLGTFQNKSVNGIRYEWDLGEFGKFGQDQVAKINFTKAGTYIFKLTAYNDATCLPPSTDFDTLFVFGGEYSISSNKEICFGESVQLEAKGGANYTWTPADGLSNPFISNPIAKPEKTTTYRVRIFTQDNCRKDTTVTVTVGEQLAPKFEVNLDNLCENLPTVRLRNLSPNRGNYLWDLGNGRTFNGFQPEAFKYERAGTYTVKLKIVQDRCSADFEEKIDIKEFDYNNFRKNIQIQKVPDICVGSSAQLKVSGGTRYLWTPATGLSNPNIGNPIASPNSPTNYKVSIFDALGCSFDTTVSVNVTDKIIANFEVKISAECGKKAQISFFNTTQGGHIPLLHLGDGRVLRPQTPNVSFDYDKSGTYTLRLEASNSGCSDTKEQIISVDNVIPPNVITPNGDGINDTFVISNVSKGWKLEIFDRWGKRVYQSDNYQNDWAGTAGASTVFFYRITSPDGKVCQGWLQVIGK